MMGIIDRTGQPRSDEELQEAYDAVTQILIKQPLVLPLFTVHGLIIRDALLELMVRRIKEEAESEHIP
jgi:hypothetical protein